MAHTKIIPYETAAKRFAELRAEGKTLVHCHGTFDMIHPGHIVHFEEAKALGDLLIVTVTAERFVNKGPGRPYFNDALRARWLAALACVDYVVIIPFADAVQAIECVRAHVYCKGREYENSENDVTGNIHGDIEAVKRVGGQIRYVGSIVFSSTKLLNQQFDPYPAEVKAFCQDVARDCSPDKFRGMVEDFRKLRVLIVGDIIFDKYTVLEVQGLTSKNRILSGRYVSEEMQAGGALAVLRHVREFTPHVRLVSLVGEEPWLEDALAQFGKPAEYDLIRSKDFTTVVKQRFVEPRVEGKELSKLFSVNYINKGSTKEELQFQVLERIADQIEDYDLVLVMDFGHGMLEDMVRVYVQQRAKFLAVNCQTNSNNHGFNILTRRYQRADAFTLDQTEMNLAVGRREIDYGRELTNLATELGSRYAWLTRGATETLGRNGRKDICKCAPFERSVVDTLGAGDAFCAAASLAAASGLPLKVATFMGQLAGAQAVKIVGNSEPIRKSKLLKAGMAMLAF
ncbi:cytidyltransferase [Opitutaceae bacterium EW11]|nr:cytidyltransferase [Opitutaceae bacterium EW11]